MAYTTINKPSEYFNTKLYTQTGSLYNGDTQTITMDNVGMVWIKNRSSTNAHALFDIIRGGNGANCLLSTNSTTGGQGSDIDSAEGLTFGSSTTTIGTDGGGYGYNNRTGDNYVAWHWRTDGTTGSSNTDGSIASTVSVSTTSGFSIVSYTGTGSAATVGHGLGAVPKMYIVKNASATNDWNVYHHSIGNTHRLFLNTIQAAEDNASAWNDTSPTSSVFSVSTNTNVNQSGSTMIAYVFAEKKGYSKFGSYTGNGNADGTFIYTGFKPSFFFWKRYNSTGAWYQSDSVRSPSNLVDKQLGANDSNLETAFGSPNIDFLSNGIKMRDANVDRNFSGGTYIYMAFAENPLVGTNNIPATAR